MKSNIARLALAFAATVAAGSCLAQAYPSKPLRLIVPFAAGGPTDSLARLISDKLKDGLGQPVVPENRPGAGMMVGAEAVAKSGTDGHTVLLTTPSISIFTLVNKTYPIDPAKELAPVSKIAIIPMIIATHANAPFKTLAELITYARANPEKVTYGLASHAGSDHLGFELLALRSKSKLTPVVYKGAAAIVPDLITGRVDLQMTTSALLRAHVESGKLRVLGATTVERSTLLPETPTIAEQGFPGFEQVPSYILMVAAGTPREIIARLDGEMRKALQQPDTIEKLRSLSLVPSYLGPEQTGAAMRQEFQTAADVIKSAGIKFQ